MEDLGKLQDQKDFKRGKDRAIYIFIGLLAFPFIYPFIGLWRIFPQEFTISLYGILMYVLAGYFVIGIIFYFIYRNYNYYFAKGFMKGSFMPIKAFGILIAVAMLVMGGCTLLFMH